MAGVAGLEPVTSAVTGQRSNQLSYAPARSVRKYVTKKDPSNSFTTLVKKSVRAADAKEVGVGNPAEETYRYPNQSFLLPTLSIGPQMSMHKGRHKLYNAFLEAALCVHKGCSFCVAWQTGDKAGAAFIC